LLALCCEARHTASSGHRDDRGGAQANPLHRCSRTKIHVALRAGQELVGKRCHGSTTTRRERQSGSCCSDRVSPQGMEAIIQRAFIQVHPFRQRVNDGRFDLIGPEDEVILPATWDAVIKPGWEITMLLSPISAQPPSPQPPRKPPAPGGRPPGGGFRMRGGAGPPQPAPSLPNKRKKKKKPESSPESSPPPSKSQTCKPCRRSGRLPPIVVEDFGADDKLKWPSLYQFAMAIYRRSNKAKKKK